MKYPHLTDIPLDYIQQLYDTSSTRAEIIEALGRSATSGGGNYTTLKKYESIWNVDLTKFNENNAIFMKLKMLKVSAVKKRGVESLIFGIRLNTATLRRILLENKLIEYKCSSCNNCGVHNSLPLTLQIDHIDGDNKNNMLSNLRFLCPNCHTQTDTFGSRNGKNYKLNQLKKKQKEDERRGFQESRKETILNSGINFKKRGWVSLLAKRLDITPQKAGHWVRKHMPTFYETECFKRNQ